MRTLCYNKDHSSSIMNCFSAPLSLFLLLHNGKMEWGESWDKLCMLPPCCTPNHGFTWRRFHAMCLGCRLVHGWRVTAEWALFPSVPTPSVTRSHALGNVPDRGKTVLQQRGRLGVCALGGHWCCRVAADKISVTGTANDSSSTFFAYLRMLVVFLHSLESRSGSWWECLDKAPGWRWKEKQGWRIKGRHFF